MDELAFVPLPTEKLQVMIADQSGKVGGDIPPLDIFQHEINTVYVRYWKNRLTSLHRVVITRTRYAQLIEQVNKGHNETFKIYSGIEASLGERAKLLKDLVDVLAGANITEELNIRSYRITKCDRQAMTIIQRTAALEGVAKWIRDNNAPGSKIVELAEEYERVVVLGKLVGAELLMLYADPSVAMSRYEELTDKIKSATGEEYRSLTVPLKEEINGQSFQRKIISATKEHCLSIQIFVLQKMLESANAERNISQSAFSASVKQADRIKLTKISEPQQALEFPVNVSFEHAMIWIELADGRVLGAPLKWFPKLREANRIERDKYKMTPVSLIWKDLDTQIHIDDLFDINNAPLYPIDDPTK
ncbi:DUF2442 domain-containing protein [Enterobacter hormaechei]|uniref:DUF2442 domain-containing protein n=2 Tax=Enterobacter hormaechei TaxID=158836 RepID=UPI0026207DC0|nr:DUF2442 domain-containing protein [Enterobacter hormaechei]